ncbi:MAG TPA: TlpA disulfide reductase family protein [Candidatus Limnocylindria bacterium]|nr:TlpA disulfide reductase family protein [Candidatus Limnocylindria bacterium]
MVPAPRALESRLQLPRWIAALFVGIIALASAAALIVPQLQPRPYVGQTNVGVITSVVDAPDTAGRVGAKAPDFVWVQPSGESMRLSALRGRPVVLNFWATWCKPCVAEMPRLEQAARDNPGIAFYEIDLDEDGAKVRGFFDSLELTHLIPLIDVGSAVARAYGLGQGVPTTFFIDADGIVRATHLGEMDVPTVATNLSLVKR